MKLPEKTSQQIVEELTKEQALDESAAKEVVSSLEAGTDINWNIVLTKQFKAETKDTDETES
jgi:hypothetical protein